MTNPVYLELTNIWGASISLSRDFAMHALPKNLDGPEINDHRRGFIFDFTPEEQTKLKQYISNKIKDVGLNPKKIFFYKSQWMPNGMWVSYGGKKFSRKTEILYNFKMASTLITTPMQVEYEKIVHSGDMFGGSHTEKRLRGVEHNVIQSYDEIKAALDNGTKSLHSEETYATYRRAGVAQAKELLDINIKNLIERQSSGFFNKLKSQLAIS